MPALLRNGRTHERTRVRVRRTRAQGAHGRVVERAAGVGREGLLARRERDRRRGGLPPNDHFPGRDPLRRPSRLDHRWLCQDALPRRGDASREAHHARLIEPVARYRDHAPVHRARLHERIVRHHRDRIRRAAVPVVDVGDVDVRHVDVGDVDVGHVHVADVRVAHVIGGVVRLFRREREPGYAPTAAGADRHAPVAPAHEHDQRRRVHRSSDHAARHPGPPVAHVHPATVVKRREAPRRVVDPRPAPRLHPGPVAVAVRRPARGHGAWHPHRTVVRRRTPLAVVVQVLVTDHVARHVARRARVVPAAVAAGAPVFPVVRADRVADVVGRGIAADDHGRLLRVHRECRT